MTIPASLGWLLRAARLSVVELPSTVVLNTLVLYEATPTHYRYRHGSILGFRPGEWLIELLSMADRVRPAPAHFEADHEIRPVEATKAG